MSLLKKVPRLLRWIFSVVLLLLAVMTIFRFIFFGAYNPPGKAFSGSAFIMGLRFDARWACGVGIAMLFLCTIPFLNPFKNTGSKKILEYLSFFFIHCTAGILWRRLLPFRLPAPAAERHRTELFTGCRHFFYHDERKLSAG